jgi:hypothetical protein
VNTFLRVSTYKFVSFKSEGKTLARPDPVISVFYLHCAQEYLAFHAMLSTPLVKFSLSPSLSPRRIKPWFEHNIAAINFSWQGEKVHFTVLTHGVVTFMRKVFPNFLHKATEPFIIQLILLLNRELLMIFHLFWFYFFYHTGDIRVLNVSRLKL